MIFFYAFRFYFKGGSKMTPVQWPYLLITIKLSCGVTPVRSRITKCPDVKEDLTSFLLYYLTCPSFPVSRYAWCNSFCPPWFQYRLSVIHSQFLVYLIFKYFVLLTAGERRWFKRISFYSSAQVIQGPNEKPPKNIEIERFIESNHPEVFLKMLN